MKFSLPQFNCDRTCPAHGELWCRFRPLLDRLGPVKVNSHTTEVKAEYHDPECVERAVLAMGGLYYGYAKQHDLYDTKQEGYGFRLPMKDGCRKIDGKPYWHHPLVVKMDGSLAYDSYGGSWGDVSQLPVLEAKYAVLVLEKACQEFGWLYMLEGGKITAFHPSGGSLTYANGKAEADGFQGVGCHEAMQSWLAQAGLQSGEVQNKPEVTACQQQVRQG